jgi:hypothetical protein
VNKKSLASKRSKHPATLPQNFDQQDVATRYQGLCGRLRMSGHHLSASVRVLGVNEAGLDDQVHDRFYPESKTARSGVHRR